MDYIIREIKKAEYDLLNDFLYEAIYIPDGVEPPPKSIINCPELQEYVFEFGKRKDDRALVAEVQGNVVGAIWVRIMNDYGHIDNDTPSLAIYYYPDCETMTDVAYYYIDELQALGDIPPSLQNYIDYEAYGRDLDMGGCFIETSRGMCEIPY